jgi:hypothetical protein
MGFEEFEIIISSEFLRLPIINETYRALLRDALHDPPAGLADLPGRCGRPAKPA